MGYTLLNKVANHLLMAGLLENITVKYYRFTDEDAKGQSDIAVFRPAGAGPRNSVVEQPDIKIILLANPANIVGMHEKAELIFRNFAGITAPEGVLKLEPLAAVMGPYFLDNGRAVFEINVRCFVQGE